MAVAISFQFCWVNKPIIFALMWKAYTFYKWRIDVTVKQFFNNDLIQISELIEKSVVHKRPLPLPLIIECCDSHFIGSILLKAMALSPL